MPTRRFAPRVAAAATAIVLASMAAAVPAAAATPSVPEPKLLWETAYDGGPGHHDHAVQIVTAKHAIYIAASTEDSENPPDFTLLRYSLGGTLRWERHLGGSADQAGAPTDLVEAWGGGVVMTGLTIRGTHRFVTTVKYGPNGLLRWEQDSPIVSQFDAPYGPQLAIGAAGSIRVSATSDGDFLVLSYDAGGHELWSRQIDVSEGQDDLATDIATDSGGRTYVVGTAGGGFGGTSTVKIGASGEVQWTHNVHGPIGSTLGPAFVAVGPDRDPVVSGAPESSCGVPQSRTWQLGPGGTEKWQTAYPSDPCVFMEPAGMRVRADGSIVVLGTLGPESDLQTLSYDQSGDLEWGADLDGGGFDLATALAIDLDGNTYVTGVAEIGLPDNDSLTASYDRAGDLRWVGRHHDGTQTERPVAIAVLDDGTVALTGGNYDPEQLEDVFTLKYRQP